MASHEQTSPAAGREHWHPGCFACGAETPLGLHLHCRPLEDGSVRGEIAPAQWMQGYGDRLQGGLVATLLDSAMTQCLFARGVAAVTATLHVRYRHPAPLDEVLTVRAWVARASHRVYRMEAQLHAGEMCLATAEAQFMALPESPPTGSTPVDGARCLRDAPPEK